MSIREETWPEFLSQALLVFVVGLLLVVLLVLAKPAARRGEPVRYVPVRVPLEVLP